MTKECCLPSTAPTPTTANMTNPAPERRARSTERGQPPVSVIQGPPQAPGPVNISGSGMSYKVVVIKSSGRIRERVRGYLPSSSSIRDNMVENREPRCPKERPGSPSSPSDGYEDFSSSDSTSGSESSEE